MNTMMKHIEAIRAIDPEMAKSLEKHNTSIAQEPIKTRSRQKKVEVIEVPKVEVVKKVKKERVKKERSEAEVQADKEKMAKIRLMRKPKVIV